MTPFLHFRHSKRSSCGRLLGTLSLAAYLLGCGTSTAASSAASRRALEVWKRHETALEHAIKGKQRNDEFGEACLFFEQVAGISVHVNIFTLGYATEPETKTDLKLIRAWYRENHERLYWDEATGTVKVRPATRIERSYRQRALELAKRVLEDELGEKYIFDYEARSNAAHAIRDLQLVELSSLLRDVAGLPYSPPSGPRPYEDRVFEHDLLKVHAITSALSLLISLGDDEALRLNRLHISSPVISTTAIRNLKQLKDWEATQQVREMLQAREPTPEAFLDLSVALEFIAASPLAEPRDCVILERLRSVFATCFDEVAPPAVSGCDDYDAAVKMLGARLGCKRNGS